MLSVSGRFGALAGDSVVTAQQVEDVRLFQAEATVRQKMLIDEKREIDAGICSKTPCVIHAAKPDSNHASAAAPDLGFLRAQLRDVLAAEDSTPVSQEGDNRRLLGPQLT